jgi:hypothetical protein
MLFRFFLFASLVNTACYANSVEESANESAQESETEIVIIKDESGLSNEALRQRATQSDTQKKAKVSMSQVVEATDKEGNVDLSKIQDRWEDLSPTPVKYDWVQTKSGEWFKGKILGLYSDVLEFDSDEVGMYDFDFDDVVQIKSYNIISVNIEDIASFPGILRLKNNKIKIIQGENIYEFKKEKVVAFAPAGDIERNFWTGKITLSFDIRSGNIEQYDYSAKGKVQRRTAETRLVVDYLGRTSSKGKVETANDHRVNENMIDT